METRDITGTKKRPRETKMFGNFRSSSLYWKYIFFPKTLVRVFITKRFIEILWESRFTEEERCRSRSVKYGTAHQDLEKVTKV